MVGIGEEEEGGRIGKGRGKGWVERSVFELNFGEGRLDCLLED